MLVGAEEREGPPGLHGTELLKLRGAAKADDCSVSCSPGWGGGFPQELQGLTVASAQCERLWETPQ